MVILPGITLHYLIDTYIISVSRVLYKPVVQYSLFVINGMYSSNIDISFNYVYNSINNKDR